MSQWNIHIGVCINDAFDSVEYMVEGLNLKIAYMVEN